MSAFADRLIEAIRAKGTPAMVGLDPRLDHLPEPFRSRATGSAAEAAGALRDFHRELLAVLAPKVAVVKPQSAFFERLGHAGVAAL
ncbi:MAG: orotidine 5'-phosphate decarboxylase, partial [Planctomycetota bacterium]